MKSKKISELRDMDTESLKKKADEIGVKISELRFAQYTKPGKNNREIKNLRKDQAVILTIKREKELLHDK